MKAKKGQSTLEYVLLVTAVLVVIIGFVAGPGSPFKTAVNQVLYNSAEEINTMAGKIMAGK
jgi:uncharacterized protein (UPF0333 family)